MATESNKANARWKTKAHRLRRSPRPRHRRNRPSRSRLRMTNPLLDSKLTHYPERGLGRERPRRHYVATLHRLRPTSGIAGELGRERMTTQSETYSSRPWRVSEPVPPRSPVITAVTPRSLSQPKRRRSSARRIPAFDKPPNKDSSVSRTTRFAHPLEHPHARDHRIGREDDIEEGYLDDDRRRRLGGRAGGKRCSWVT